MDIYQALDTLIKNCPNPWAVTYAKVVPQAYGEYGDEGVRIQILYILSNLDDDEMQEEYMWKGTIAEEVIKILENYKIGQWVPIEKRN